MTLPLHVIVIGAGTGGMCLAHGLKKAGVSVAVYERDKTRSDALLGYRVGINPDGSRALHACLPKDLYATFVATCARPMKRGNFFTEQLSEVLSLPFPENYDAVNSEKSVSRVTLRQVLLTDMEDIVHFGKNFTHYTQNKDDTITAFFADGTSATGDVLVAADGTRSAVRQQYLPHARLEDAEVVSAAGKVPLTDEVKSLLPEKMLEGTTLIFAPKGYFSIVHVMEFNWDMQGEVKGGVGSVDTELIQKWPGLLYDNTRDHLIWGVAAPLHEAPDNFLQTRGTDLISLVKKMTPQWSPALHKLFELSDPSTCFAHKVATSVPIPQWETTNITLLGDAIHTMTPGRGVGANTALRDAALLCRKLIAARDEKLPLRQAIHEYETRMIDYGFTAVRESLKQHGKDNPLQKPFLGSVMLAVMRGFMRIINMLPPIKRKMAQGMLRSRGADRVED